MAWLLGKGQSFPAKTRPGCLAKQDLAETGPSKNMVLVLMGVHMAPNRVLTGSPGRELRGGADGVGGLVPNILKYANKNWDPAGSGRVWAGFSGFSPEWSGKVREGPGTIFGGPGG